MASMDELYEAISDAIVKLANEATPDTSMSETYATAARQLAEAYAWLRFPNQSHGGGVANK
jgi:hypothetical protein